MREYCARGDRVMWRLSAHGIGTVLTAGAALARVARSIASPSPDDCAVVFGPGDQSLASHTGHCRRITIGTCGAAVLVFTLLPYSAADANSRDRIWEESLAAVGSCESALNDTLSVGSRCLLGTGLDLLLGAGMRFADEYGQEVFGEHFQLVGDLTYLSEAGLGADLDAVVPLSQSASPEGGPTSSSFFFQQGITRWWNSGSNRRSDLRHGVVHRFRVSAKPNADIFGISTFYQHNAEHGHQVLVSGVDYAGRWLGGSAKYFKPTTGWRSADFGYEERALEGVELSLNFNVTTTVRADVTGYRWQSEDVSEEWNLGTRLGFDWRPHPWLTLNADYDRAVDGRDSLSALARLTVPLGGSSKQLPRWEGLGVAVGGSAPNDSDLWRPVDDIGRIRVATRADASALVESAEIRFLQDTVGSGDVVRLEIVLSAAAPEDIRVEVRLVPGSGDNPAVPGEDFVDQPVELTIAQGATTGGVSIQLLRNNDVRENRSLGATVSLNS